MYMHRLKTVRKVFNLCIYIGMLYTKKKKEKKKKKKKTKQIIDRIDVTVPVHSFCSPISIVITEHAAGWVK